VIELYWLASVIPAHAGIQKHFDARILISKQNYQGGLKGNLDAGFHRHYEDGLVALPAR